MMEFEENGVPMENEKVPMPLQNSAGETHSILVTAREGGHDADLDEVGMYLFEDVTTYSQKYLSDPEDEADSDHSRCGKNGDCRIDRRRTQTDGYRLKLVLSRLPEHLEMIHYRVAVKNGPLSPWADSEDAKKQNMKSVPVEKYLRDGMILVEAVPKGDLYVSVVGEYRLPDGSTAFSEGSWMRLRNSPKHRIEYFLLWKTTGLLGRRFVSRGCRLVIRCSEQIIPEMKLVYRRDGHIPMDLEDQTCEVLHVVPKTCSGWPEGEYVYDFPDSTWGKLHSRTALRLMLEENTQEDYETVCPDVSSLRVP